MDDGDGEPVVTLELAEGGQEAAEVGGAVLVGGMKAHEGVEHQETGADGGDGVDEAGPLRGLVEPEAGRVDEAQAKAGRLL